MKVIVKHDKTKATLQRGLQNQRHLNGAQMIPKCKQLYATPQRTTGIQKLTFNYKKPAQKCLFLKIKYFSYLPKSKKAVFGLSSSYFLFETTEGVTRPSSHSQSMVKIYIY